MRTHQPCTSSEVGAGPQPELQDPGPPGEPREVPPPPPAREAYFDNVKLLLVLLVVVGHLLELLRPGNPVARGAFAAIYSFHVPLFVLVAGYFSRRMPDAGRMLRLLSATVVPYVLFQVLYRAHAHLVFGTLEVRYDLLHPYFALWFLVSLLFWRMAIHYLATLRFPLLIALIAGVLIGLAEADLRLLSLGRTVAFFPFFVAGYQLKESQLALLARWPARVGAALVLLGGTVAAFLFEARLDHKLFFHTQPHARLGLTSWTGSVTASLALYGAAALMGLAFLALVPRRRFFFSSWGERSLYVYLLHGFVIEQLDAFELVDRLRELVASKLVQVLAAAAAGTLLTVLLSQRFVQRLTRPLLEPRPERVRVLAVWGLVLLLPVLALPSLRYLGVEQVRADQLGMKPAQTAPAGGLLVRLGSSQGGDLELAWQGRDELELRYFRKGKPVGDPQVVRAGSEGGKVRVRAPARRSSYDSVAVFPRGGEAPWSLQALKTAR